MWAVIVEVGQDHLSNERFCEAALQEKLIQCLPQVFL